jgi:hypothetical protein
MPVRKVHFHNLSNDWVIDIFQQDDALLGETTGTGPPSSRSKGMRLLTQLE